MYVAIATLFLLTSGLKIFFCAYHRLEYRNRYSQSARPIQHTVNLVFEYKVFLKVYFNVKIHADFKSVCSQTQNVERFAKSMF